MSGKSQLTAFFLSPQVVLEDFGVDIYSLIFLLIKWLLLRSSQAVKQIALCFVHGSTGNLELPRCREVRELWWGETRSGNGLGVEWVALSGHRRCSVPQHPAQYGLPEEGGNRAQRLVTSALLSRSLVIGTQREAVSFRSMQLPPESTCPGPTWDSHPSAFRVSPLTDKGAWGLHDTCYGQRRMPGYPSFQFHHYSMSI